jgi:hypothetical protein
LDLDFFFFGTGMTDPQAERVGCRA